jgi:hypothetical protein
MKWTRAVSRAPTAAELDLFRERFLILLEREWRADPTNFAAVPGATIALTENCPAAQLCAGARDRRMARICAVQAREGGSPVLGLPAAFADDTATREEITRMGSSQNLPQILSGIEEGRTW